MQLTGFVCIYMDGAEGRRQQWAVPLNSFKPNAGIKLF